MKKIIAFALCSLFVFSVSFDAQARKKKATKKTAVTAVSVAQEPAISQVTVPAKEALEGEWTVLSVKNKKVATRDRVFLNFNFADNRFYGNNGCNVINGDFKAKNNGDLTLSNVISTMMSCHNATSEKTIMKAINDVASYRYSVKDGIKYLTLLNSKGGQLLTMKNADLSFLNGAWTVKELDGEAVTDDNVKLVIDIQELKLHGNSGCNIVNGTLYIDAAKDWAIQFQQLISTRKLCPNMQIETALLVALEETEKCRKINDNEVALLNGKGDTTVILTRLSLK